MGKEGASRGWLGWDALATAYFGSAWAENTLSWSREFFGLESPCPGPLAQLAEQETFNLLVVGSSPTGPTELNRMTMQDHSEPTESDTSVRSSCRTRTEPA